MEPGAALNQNVLKIKVFLRNYIFLHLKMLCLVCSNPPVVEYATAKCYKNPSTESDTCSYICKQPRRTLSVCSKSPKSYIISISYFFAL